MKRTQNHLPHNTIKGDKAGRGTVILDGTMGDYERLEFKEAQFRSSAGDNVSISAEIYSGDVRVWSLTITFPDQPGIYEFGREAGGTLFRDTDFKDFTFYLGTVTITALDIDAGILEGTLVNVGSREDPSFLISHGSLDFK